MNNPGYYTLFGTYQVINLIEDRLKELHESSYKPKNPIIYSNYANVIKYTMRWYEKDGIEDLYKAVDYLQAIIKEYEEAKPFEFYVPKDEDPLY